MKIKSVKNRIEKLGGKANYEISETEFSRQYHELNGIINGYDIHMFNNGDDETDFFTARKVENRGEYDPGSDYNPGGYIFCNRVNDIDWLNNRN